MHTQIQAQTLWCPMARVAQVGAIETAASYNRALIKSHFPVKIADTSPETFELGHKPEVIEATMLKVQMDLSGASRCVAGKCAMWRWAEKAPMMVKRKTWSAPDGLTDEELIAGEPARPGALPPYAVWLPVENIDTDDSSGGYWIEPDEDAQKRIEAITNSRQGHCGIAGRAEVF